MWRHRFAIFANNAARLYFALLCLNSCEQEISYWKAITELAERYTLLLVTLQHKIITRLDQILIKTYCIEFHNIKAQKKV